MKKITISDIVPHAIAFGAFIVVTVIFFSPVFFDDKSLNQQDIQQHLAASKSLRDFREATGEEGLWTPSMFSGMPAYLVNLQWSDGVLVTMKRIMTAFVPSQVRNILAAFVCYYIMLLSFRIRPYLAIAGALAFGLSSYMIIGLSAGHNARIGAIAFIPMVVAGVHLIFTNHRILGFGLTSLGLAFQLRENHIQITYYLAIILVVYGIVQLIYSLRQRLFPDFLKSVVVLMPAIILSVLTFFGQLWAVSEYSKYSIRGTSELVRSGANTVTDGLTREYAFEYTYGILEPMTLLIPDFYGGSSMKSFLTDVNSASYKALTQAGDNKLANELAGLTGCYWGPQEGTIGPYYAGAIIVFLFVIGILFADKKYLWWLLPVSIFSIMISWGDSFKTFNYFLFDYLPVYNKFRSYSFGLIIVLFSMPLLGMLGVENLMKNPFTKLAKRKFFIAASVLCGFCLMLILFSGAGSFQREGESKLPAWFYNSLKIDRISLFRLDAMRSMIFIALGFVVLYLGIDKKISPKVLFTALTILILLDISLVDKRYFTKDNYHPARTLSFSQPFASDEAILRDKTYYRVYDITESWGMSARASYHHHSLNGYHGAKLKRYQDLYDSAISSEAYRMVDQAQSGTLDFRNFGVLNMLNTKYILYGTERNRFIHNRHANGPAWFVNETMLVNSPNEELKRIGEIDTKKVAVINEQRFGLVNTGEGIDTTATIQLTDHSKPYLLQYKSHSLNDGLAVFSEIYYPAGWHAEVDGVEVPILCADYVLRALEIPKGDHVIEFKYTPEPYTIGNSVTEASSWVLCVIFLLCVGWSLKEK